MPGQGQPDGKIRLDSWLPDAYFEFESKKQSAARMA
jgi:hypothetical protein